MCCRRTLEVTDDPIHQDCLILFGGLSARLFQQSKAGERGRKRYLNVFHEERRDGSYAGFGHAWGFKLAKRFKRLVKV